MYHLHIANKNYSSWSLRPWILMKSLGIGFQETLHPFTGGYGQNPALKAFSPSGLVPVLIDEDQTLWDSLAIALYLGDRHEGVWPKDKKARAFAQSAACEMHSGFSTLRNRCGMNLGLRIRLHDISPALRRELERLTALFKQGLDQFGGPFLAGPQFSAVDAFFAPVAFRIQGYGLELGPKSMAYVATLLGLEGMKDWYQAALLEPYREEGHEAECRQAGVILQDLRQN